MRFDIADTYLVESLSLIGLLTISVLMGTWLLYSMPFVVGAVCVAVVFQLVACIAYGLVWKKVYAVSPASLPTLYLAASAFRMFAGIATVLVYCFLSGEKVAIRFFVIIFIVYYFVILAYDTWYFVKAEKKIKQNVIK